MTLANAAQIMRVITPENKVQLLEMGQSLSKRELEKEIKKTHPERIPQDRTHPLTRTLSEMKLVIPHQLERDLRRLQDLYSKKSNKCLTLVETLQLMTEQLIKRHDPVKKAERNLFPLGFSIPAQHSAIEPLLYFIGGSITKTFSWSII